MSELKHEDLFFELKPQYTQWGDWCYSPQLYFRGAEDMPGANYNVGWQIFTRPIHTMEPDPHFHREEEYLVFINADLYHPDEFDAEIEIFVGYDVKNMEKHIITKPTILRLPGSMWHCPMDFKKIGKPIMFQAVYMHGSSGRVIYRKAEDGTDLYIYGGPEIRRGCRLDPTKEKCTYCGKCFDLAGEGK